MSVEKDGIVGWGEAAPGKNENADSPEKVVDELKRLVAQELMILAFMKLKPVPVH